MAKWGGERGQGVVMVERGPEGHEPWGRPKKDKSVGVLTNRYECARRLRPPRSRRCLKATHC